MRNVKIRTACASVMGMTIALLAGGRASADSHELFIGNSLTATNNLPALVRQMRSVSGAPMDYFPSAATTLGVGLDWHWADASAQSGHALLAPGGWDGVVLQDLSFNATDNPNKTVNYIHLWNQEIKTKSPDAVTYLFAHWERQDRLGSQPVIDQLYRSMGAELDATVVPAGDTWAALQAARPDIVLYTDPVHPTLRGSYAAAATFYASFFGQSPVGLAPPQGISSVDALAIQNAAWDVVSGRQTAVNRTWIAGGGGNWSDAANWNVAGVPAAGDSISIATHDGISRVINYSSENGASILLGSLTISADSGSITIQQSQSTLRVAGNIVLGDSSGGSADYQLSGTGRIFANSIEVKPGGTFTLAGGKIHGKLINEGVAILGVNSGRGSNPQLDVEAAGSASSVITATADQDLRSLVVDYSNPGTQGFDLASNSTSGQYRTIRIYPPDAASLSGQRENIAAAIEHALLHPGDGIFDSGLPAASNVRIGVATQRDEEQRSFLLMRPTVVGDVNLDGNVSIADFLDLATNFNIGSTWETGDLNYDGNVTIADFVDLASNFGRSYSGETEPITFEEQSQLNAFAATHVPEANSIVLVGISSLLVGLRRKR